MTRKRKSQAQAGPSTITRPRRAGTEPPPQPTPPPPNDVQKTQYVNRKCKLGPLLRPQYKAYKDMFRTVAEEYSTLREDAMNFVLLILIQFFITQQTELVGQYTNRMPQLQRVINQLNHTYPLANQLLNELLNQDSIVSEVNVTAEIQNLAAPVTEQLNLIRLHIPSLIEAIRHITTAIAEGNGDINPIVTSHILLNQIQPYITNLMQSIPQLLQFIRRTTTQLTGDITASLTERNQNLINTIIQARDVENQVAITIKTLQNSLNELRRADMSTDELSVQARFTAQIQLLLQNQQAHLDGLRIFEQRNQQTIQTEEVQQCLHLDDIRRQLNTLNIQYALLFQQTEIINQQLAILVAPSEGHNLFPKLTDATFWSHVYRKVASDPNQLNNRIRFNPSLERNFPDFDISRKIPGTAQDAYQVPTLDGLHIAISQHYGSSIIQNVVMHFLNTRLWVSRVFKGYFIHILHLPRLQEQQLRSLPINTLAKKAVDGIINHRPFNEITFRHEDGEVTEEELGQFPAFDDLQEVYRQVQMIYEADFARIDYDEKVNDYSYASAHPLKYVRVSYRLLQLATSLSALPIKVWSLIPGGSHSIVHFPLSGVQAVYRLFEKAHRNNLPVPAPLIVDENTFITYSAFDMLYFRHENKRNLWNTLFDLEKLEGDRVRLAFGLKTDGHMISILYEKTDINFVPQNRRDTLIQPRRKNLQNWTKGLYPLYKNPFGISEEDRIIGIDPGVRDIICGVDCDQQELTNKQSSKQHSFSISNASYKMRSGMSWIKQKELSSRLNANIQPSYDRLQSRKICTNEGVMQYLNSLSGERTEIHNYMKGWRHRENKGYAFSNRQMATEHAACVVLGRTKTGEDYQLAHHSSSRSRRKRRRMWRRQHEDQLRDNGDERRTIVAYGDASIRGTYKGNTPVPVKSIQRAIAQKAIVITVDEFRTSVTCCHCQQRLVNVESRLNVCNHRKKKQRSAGLGGNMFETRSTSKCYNEESHILHRTSQCPERRLTGNRVVYPLKLCPQCPANNNNQLFWNRDVNAAVNIRSILVEYIRQDYNLESRPAPLSRGQQDQGVL